MWFCILIKLILIGSISMEIMIVFYRVCDNKEYLNGNRNMLDKR